MDNELKGKWMDEADFVVFQTSKRMKTQHEASLLWQAALEEPNAEIRGDPKGDCKLYVLKGEYSSSHCRKGLVQEHIKGLKDVRKPADTEQAQQRTATDRARVGHNQPSFNSDYFKGAMPAAHAASTGQWCDVADEPNRRRNKDGA